MIKKIQDWLQLGGDKFLGYDSAGDPMYSVSNGETLMMLTVCALGIIAMLCIAGLVVWL